jgi:hypothetical protein
MTCNVNSVEGAAEQLVRWTKRGPKWNKAVRSALLLWPVNSHLRTPPHRHLHVP